VQTIVTYHLEAPGEQPPSATLAPVLEQVRLADALGYNAAWFAEHHFGGHRSVMPAPLLLATYVAARTERLKVGTSVICLPLHHPVDIAEQVAVADVLTGGRLSIGFGSGSAAADFKVFASDQETRHRRFEEQLAIVTKCWSGRAFDYRGEFYQLDRVTCVPTPVQTAAELTWLAASSEPTARLAGQLGFGLQLPRGRPPAAYTPVVAAYREEWRAAGHPNGGERVSIARCLYVGQDDAEALETVAGATHKFAQRWSPSIAADTSTAGLIDRMHFCVGGPETVVRGLMELREHTNLTHLSIQPTWEDLPPAAACDSLRRFAELVRPRL